MRRVIHWSLTVLVMRALLQQQAVQTAAAATAAGLQVQRHLQNSLVAMSQAIHQ
jgi:hypothetical protein